MPLLSAISKLFSGPASGIISQVGEVVDKFVTTGPERIELQARLDQIANEHEATMAGIQAAEMESARKLQAAALAQDDTFSKRFNPYLAAATVIISFVIILLMFFVTIPPGNERIIDLSIGILLGSGLAQVYAFYFGSSKSSQDKNTILKNISTKP